MLKSKDFYGFRRMKQGMASKPLSILLVSKTSFDKAACGNTILQNEVFSADELEGVPIPVTRCGSFRGRVVEVTDTPGLMDSYSKERSRQTMNDFLTNCGERYDAVVIVLRYPVRMTPEEEESIQMIKEIIGENSIADFGILLFTNGASFKRHQTPTFEEYLDREVNAYQGFQNTGRITLGRFITDVRNRCVIFDNDTDDPTEVNEQIEKLFDTIDQMKLHNYQRKFPKVWPWKKHKKKFIFAVAAVGVVVLITVIVVVTGK